VMVPGFTAERSLRGLSDGYRMIGTAEGSTAQQIIPARPCCENCDYSCDRCELQGPTSIYCRACRNCLTWCVPCGGWF